MEQFLAFGSLFLAAVLLMLPFEAANLRKRAKVESLDLSSASAFRLAFLSTFIGFSLGAIVFGIILFGPSFITPGDSSDLPWVTIFPATIVGAFAGKKASGSILSNGFSKLKKINNAI
jgi:hypothetical protein